MRVRAAADAARSLVGRGGLCSALLGLDAAGSLRPGLGLRVALVGLGFDLGSGPSPWERLPFIGTMWRWFDLHFNRSFDVMVLQSLFGLKLFDSGAVLHAQTLVQAGLEKAGAAARGASALAAYLVSRPA